MSTQALVDALVARLKVIPNLGVEDMPDHPRAEAFLHPKAALWVAYNGSRFGAAQAVDFPVQERMPRFELALLVRGIRGPQGATGYLDAIRALAHGFRLPNLTPLRYVSEDFVNHNNGVWHFEIALEAGTVAVPDLAAGPESPAVTKLSFESATETTEVVPEPEEEED